MDKGFAGLGIDLINTLMLKMSYRTLGNRITKIDTIMRVPVFQGEFVGEH